MPFLRNHWYCAAWAAQITRTPLARTLLGEKLVLYRKVDGGIVALGDRCPHRFAPLHVGSLHGDNIACKYHGLQFAPDGHCALNPHGDVIPPAAKVVSYPMVEHQGVAWIWMGDIDLMDEGKIPQLNGHTDGWRTVHGMIEIQGNYELVSDNLLDLSHTQFLHSLLTNERDDTVTHKFDLKLEGDTVHTREDFRNSTRSGFVSFIWPDGPERVDSFGGLRWQPPSNMLLKVRFTKAGEPEGSGLNAWGGELVTPETETTCHYFFSLSRDFRLDDDAFDVALVQAVTSVFQNEDGWILGLIQQEMGEQTDLLAMRPILLPTDRAALTARRIMSRLKREDAERTAAKAATKASA